MTRCRIFHSSWWVGPFAALAICVAGCRPSQPTVPAKPPVQVDAGTHVALISQSGDFSLVETADGRQFHIPSDRLVGTRESSDNKEYAVICKTDVFDGTPPDKPPALPAPRMGKEIDMARDELPVLFLTPSGREVQLTRRAREPSFDPQTKELLWFAMTCKNPDCPGKNLGKNGRPFLFICPDPMYAAGPDGPVFVPPQPGQPGRQRLCPECAKIRNPGAEAAEQNQQYQGWCQTYVLPESQARADQLNKEHSLRIQLNRQEGREASD